MEERVVSTFDPLPGHRFRTVADCRYRNGEADAALIVEAVNSYDRLRRIEAAARGPVLGAFDVLASLREVARQAGNADLIAALEPARHAEAALRTALGED
jgi:hypothetical protein